jgi:exopolysaccharide biosynthesis polyprenyl glycosylphosphotransferase
MLIDFLTVLVAGGIATTSECYADPITGAPDLYRGVHLYGRPIWILFGLLCGLALSLVVSSRRLHLYTPSRVGSLLHEQRLTVEACFTSGLLLTGTLYLVRVEDIPRRVVMLTLLIATLLVCVRRLIQRSIMHRRFQKGQNTRNILIVGTGPEAHALRQHLDSIRNLGFTFKGFIEFPGPAPRSAASRADVVGSLDTLFQHARQQFVDEIFFTMPCERRVVLDALQKARMDGIDLRVVPDLYEGLAWDNPIEFVGQFPTIPLHRGCVHELGFAFKRMTDVLFSVLVLLALSPFLSAIALAILIESRGPVFYKSQRIGKKGRVFRCYKFRTMVRDAERHRSEIMHMNERDGVFFKVSNDPRITRLGRILRKYSLDELPQFINVLKGDMSVVGPRPPIASEVMDYELSHLRRLDVTPGISGL